MVMRRGADLAVIAALLLLGPFSCHAGTWRPKSKEPEGCVTAKTRNAYSDVRVATCGLAQDLEQSTQDLQAEVVTLEKATDASLVDQGEKMEDLREDVDFLQGKRRSLKRFSYFIADDRSDLRPFCELYTLAEAQELTRLIYGREKAEPSWIYSQTWNAIQTHITKGKHMSTHTISWVPFSDAPEWEVQAKGGNHCPQKRFKFEQRTRRCYHHLTEGYDSTEPQYCSPNAHMVHIPCAPDCPDEFWKIRQGCYRPNDPIIIGLSPWAECVYDPLPLNETCTRYVYLGPDGYTPNLDPDWSVIGPDGVHEE